MSDSKKMLNLSAFLNQLRQLSALQPKATFWFGAVLSLLQENEHKQIQDDTDTPQKAELIRLMTGVLAAVAGFYKQERPAGVYKLLRFVDDLLERWSGCGEYLFVLVKVGYLNMLAIYHLKIKQYSYSLDVFALIYDLYLQKPVDCTNEPFLTSLSNYLSFLSRTGKGMQSRRTQVEVTFVDLFFKFFSKFIELERESLFESQHNTLVLLAGVFKGHSLLLHRFEQDLNSAITHFYQQTVKGGKFKLPDNMVTFVVKRKVREALIFRIALSTDQLLYYAASQVRTHRTRRDQQALEVRPQPKLNKMEVMLSQTIDMLQEQKLGSLRYATLDDLRLMGKSSALPAITLQPELPLDTIEVGEGKTTRRAPARSGAKKREALKESKKVVPRMSVRKTVKFKIFSIFVDVYEDGILLSDYTNENKQYLEWNTVSLLVERLEGQFVFEEFLRASVSSYFDFVRVLAPFLIKNESREICLLPRPVPLLEVNSLLRLYKQEGRYLKLALMNRYDTLTFVGVVDLFLDHFDQFFKELSENEYILMLNIRVSRTVESPETPERDPVFHLDFIKRKRQTTAAELGNLLPLNVVEAVVEDKDSVYKCILLLRNNLHLLVRLVAQESSASQSQSPFLTIKIQSLDRFLSEGLYGDSGEKGEKGPGKVSQTLKVPLELLTNYFPLQDRSVKEYQLLYGRMIVDCLSCEEGSTDPSGLSFGVVVHCARVEMIEYGRYYSVVSAELVGSQDRIWALVIRFYDLAALAYRVTVLVNPYDGFLKNLVGAERQEQGRALRNLLVGESVRETVLWLKRTNQLGTRLSLVEYLQLHGLI